MSNVLVETIVSEDEAVRHRSIDSLLHDKDRGQILKLAGELEAFRTSSDNLYHKVRASLFLFAIYRFHLMRDRKTPGQGKIPSDGVKAAFARDFEKSIAVYLREINDKGVRNRTVFSAVADAYYKLSFKYLIDQVKLSISRRRENHHLYNIDSPDEYPFSVPAVMTAPDPVTGLYPVGMDASPVRLDPSHSGWSDIFFLGMDFPEGARVVNLSVDLRIHGGNEPLRPPCECWCRFIREPVIHLVSTDLRASKKIHTLRELFNFGNDHLSLLKAGVVASGIIPPCFENRDIRLQDILKRLTGETGGIQIVTRVNGIPKGSRLAVSTTLLAAIITQLMRFSGQIRNLTGPLQEEDRRIVASRAILGEWLGGSGGGWQDSGGLWPGIKLITGVAAAEGDPEFGVSRGCLLPRHHVFTEEDIPPGVEKKIVDSMVLVHGGISQDVGPILEMVTEKYLLKYERQWQARLKGISLFDEIVDALKAGDMRELGRLTTEDWEEAIQPVVPWVNNAFTEDLINRLGHEFRGDYLGFLMLGGMSGGGMAFIVNPGVRDVFKKRAGEIMNDLKAVYSSSYPFIIDPVVYDFAINHEGITAGLFTGGLAKMPVMPPAPAGVINLNTREGPGEEEIREKYGFDPASHEHMKAMLKRGEIGLAKNRLPRTAVIEDVRYGDILHFEDDEDALSSGAPSAFRRFHEAGMEALRKREAAVVTFAGGMGSRWSRGAAVVKPVNPFVKMDGRYRTFIEIHLAKSKRTGMLSGHEIQHVFTTSYLTHHAIARYLRSFSYFGCAGRIHLSPSKTIGRRVYPMERDLRFHWEGQLRQKLDDNAQKVLDDTHAALIEWAKQRGEGEDYSENSPILRFNPPGHWYEIPNMLKNGVLARMIRDNPGLKYLLCHNIDTLGAYIEPVLLGMHIAGEQCITFEVTPRRIEDTGGGLARVDGHIRLVEGTALPREEDEFELSYYNTLTNWITVDSLLEFFGIDRDTLLDGNRRDEILDAVRGVERRIPTYVTIKDVKYVWGSGQEDVYPVAQFEKLWGDMSGLKDLKAAYVAVSRHRGMQLKEPSLLDMWANDGSFEYVKNRASF